ncbi:hypothetical protein ASPWEDRAFT_172649 [Aspergillus wentii DTO 134E9]|uniref:Uncharacterized protein n=1 Tax=Aspergillus wentii DTO 134E9 TaxID=1073089 RepID=A0A1L9RLN8_ASPWE|nr:uncharacterized protein ASPWEDRAFT_172649 [Aspergillus wentii DTO 134E9]OJJ35860.1 hypothetical protein ASPWEDRAFT_172649 [Aspergillus wentii DTO 134E9]
MPNWPGNFRWHDDQYNYKRCIICGGGFTRIRLEPVWTDLFRAVYRCDDIVILTGVGCTKADEHDEYEAPNDPAARWQNMGEDYIALAKKPNSLKYVFLFHEVCWDTIAGHFTPDELDLDELYEALQYMPLLPG